MGSSPINVDEVKKALSDYPDQNIDHSITHGLEFEFKLNYSGPRLPFDMHSRDIFWELYDIANRKIFKEINLGRIVDPFPEPPFPTFPVSPISVIPKKSSTEFRLIHNLSFPPSNSVNDFIDQERCVRYKISISAT